MLFETMGCDATDEELFKKVRKYKGKKWSSSLVHIKSLRLRYLDLQNHRCVYCQSVIDANANGHRELEHILPKSPSEDSTHATSNELDKRRSTNGYPDFSFEPLNLCLSCKVCNPKKGTFDPLRDRTSPITSYPGRGSYLWFHPHFDKYSEHIILNENFTFTRITAEGAAVISACGLDDAKLLAERFSSRAAATVSRNKNRSLKNLIAAVAMDIDQKKYSLNDGAASITAKRPEIKMDTAINLLRLWCAHLEADDNFDLRESAYDAVRVVATSLIKRTEA